MARTVIVPLSDLGASFVGAVLLFAGADGTLAAPARPAGAQPGYNGYAVHGVTRLDAGTRWREQPWAAAGGRMWAGAGGCNVAFTACYFLLKNYAT